MDREIKIKMDDVGITIISDKMSIGYNLDTAEIKHAKASILTQEEYNTELSLLKEIIQLLLINL